MEDKKKGPPAFDADFIMNQMKEGVRQEGMTVSEDLTVRPVAGSVSVGKEKNKNKKNPVEGYETMFFKNPDSSARNGKSVYISPEFHERLSRIVQVIGEDKLTLYAYLHNVLEHHFSEFGDDIVKSFNDKYKPIL